MTDFAALLQTGPEIDDHGVPVGYGDWRLAVELLVPSPADVGLWGSAVWGSSRWGAGLEWHDITDDVRGATWERGAQEFDGRPEIGVLELTLDNVAGTYSPIDPDNSLLGLVQTQVGPATLEPLVNGYLRPGTLLRIVVWSADGWGWIEGEGPGLDEHGPGALPEGTWEALFTGVVESWPATDVEGAADRFVDVTVVETLAVVARVDELALASVVGDDDTFAERVTRLLEACDWPFGVDVEPNVGAAGTDTEPLQSTNMADNRLAELYRTADSVGCGIRSGRDGRAQLTAGALIGNSNTVAPFGPFTDIPPTFTAVETLELNERTALAVDARELVIDNDNRAVVNVAEFARVGGSVQRVVDEGSIRRMKGRVTAGRVDLLNKSDTVTHDIAAATIEGRAHLLTRVSSVTVRNDQGPYHAAAMISLDVGSGLEALIVESPARSGNSAVFMEARVDGMRHTLTPAAPGEIPVWEVSYRLGRQDAVRYSRES